MFEVTISSAYNSDESLTVKFEDRVDAEGLERLILASNNSINLRVSMNEIRTPYYVTSIFSSEKIKAIKRLRSFLGTGVTETKRMIDNDGSYIGSFRHTSDFLDLVEDMATFGYKITKFR